MIDNKVGPELLNSVVKQVTCLDENDADWLKCHHVPVLRPLVLYEHEEGGEAAR
jgi:hypothetical protein